ncbi:hypothetical protein [Streptomyces sp. NPDC093223]|uniref:hypothetical protein n=1 Tax=Streptomyces sp. NPDC093223 TaxID=3366033 RepID=UPI00380610F7
MPKFVTGRKASDGESANRTGLKPPAGYVPSGPVPVGGRPQTTCGHTAPCRRCPAEK